MDSLHSCGLYWRSVEEQIEAGDIKLRVHDIVNLRGEVRQLEPRDGATTSLIIEVSHIISPSIIQRPDI